MKLRDLNRSQHPTIRFLIQIRVVFGLYIHITDSARHGKTIFFEAGGCNSWWIVQNFCRFYVTFCLRYFRHL